MGVLTGRHLWHFLVLASLTRLPYPSVRRDVTVFDDYHGTKVEDPYRWLEDLDSKETQQFVEQQQNLTASFLAAIPQREAIRQRLTDVWNYPKFSAPEKAAHRYFTFQNSGLQNQSIMYVQDGLDREQRVFLDPNKLSEDGTVALDSYTFSFDGELFAYSLSQSGSDWKIVRFKNVSTGVDLPDKLLDCKWPSLQFSRDDKGVFYSRFPSPKKEKSGPTSAVTENNKIFYHRIGTSQDEDILIAEFPESPQRTLYVQVSDCGDYVIIGGQKEFNANTIHVACLKGGINAQLKSKLVPIFPNESEATYTYVTNVGQTFLFQTSKDAPNFKLITIDINVKKQDQLNVSKKEREVGQFSLWSTFLEEHPKNVLDWAVPVDNDKLVICYLADVKNTMELRSLRDGSIIHKFDLPPGSISGLSNDGKKDNEFFFSLQNFLSPGTIYRCEIVNGSVDCKVIKQIQVANTDLTAFVTEQVFYPSKDGTLIPMYIVRKKDLALDGTAPTLLYGYGGFNSVLLPRYSVSNLVFVENFNGIYALANIRGGGEYGEKWHAGGSLLNKQNVFDDFQAAAEYLVQRNYTQSSKLVIQGGSNGGLLVGACVNQRPDLFGAAIAQVGVMDMLRFQKFTIGYAWCSEYGCSEEQKYFDNLIKYSPLHNIRLPENELVQYPSVLVTTADHDDRVVPSHSFKYIAQLQHVIGQSPRQTNPLLLRVDSKAGHGAGKPTSKKIEEVADIYAFLVEVLRLEFKVTEYKSNSSVKKSIIQ